MRLKSGRLLTVDRSVVGHSRMEDTFSEARVKIPCVLSVRRGG